MRIDRESSLRENETASLAHPMRPRRGAPRQLRATHALTAAFAVVSVPVMARASGVELPDNGTISMGRAGAVVARTSDPTVIMHNVAGIVGLPGLQIELSGNFGYFQNCFSRSGNYDPRIDNIRTTGTVFAGSHYNNGMTPYPQTCKQPSLAAGPQLLATYRFNRYVAIGGGIYAPNTTGATQNFPDQVTTDNGLAPSPARNMLFQKGLLVFYPTLAIAVSPVPWLRFGVALQAGYASFNFGVMANAISTQAQSPDTDLFFRLVADGVVFAGSGGVQLLPLPWLSFGANVHYNAPMELHGHGDTIAGYYSADPNGRSPGVFDITAMRLQLPTAVRAGVRFNLPRAGRPHQNEWHGTVTYDPMVDDVFDVEAVFSYESSSFLSRTDVTTSGVINAGAGVMIPAPGSNGTPLSINSHLNNVYGVRVGGDWNVLPGVLALRAGWSLETGSEDPAYAQIHVPGLATTSVNAGASYRWRMLTFSIAYGHTFFFDLDATRTGNGSVITPNPMFPPSTPDSPTACADSPMAHTAGPGACQINRGLFQASFDAISVQATARFL